MATIKISSKVEEKAWEDLRELAQESRQSISGLLTEAVEEYVARRRVRPPATASRDQTRPPRNNR